MKLEHRVGTTNPKSSILSELKKNILIELKT